MVTDHYSFQYLKAMLFGHLLVVETGGKVWLLKAVPVLYIILYQLWVSLEEKASKSRFSEDWKAFFISYWLLLLQKRAISLIF